MNPPERSNLANFKIPWCFFKIYLMEIYMHVRMAIFSATPWYGVLSDLHDIGGEIEIRETRRAAVAIRAKITSLLPEQKRIDGDVHARPIGYIISEHMSSQ